MKQLCVCLFAGIAVSVVRPGPVESSILAAMRLSEAPNYTWVSSIEDDACTYEITGQTVRGGVTLVRMPLVSAVRQRLGRDAPADDIEAIFVGHDHCVIHTETGWQTLEELASSAKSGRGIDLPGASIGLPDVGLIGTTTSIQMGAPTGSALRVSRRGPYRPGAPYSNLQLGISQPHENLGVIVSSHAEWNVEGDVVRGTLTNLGAQLLLVHEGQPDMLPLKAGGTFKLWIRDGVVMRYQVHLEGVISVERHGYEREVEVHESTDTRVKGIGTTHFEVPLEVKVKLGG